MCVCIVYTIAVRLFLLLVEVCIPGGLLGLSLPPICLFLFTAFTTHLHLVSRLTLSGAIPPLPQCLHGVALEAQGKLYLLFTCCVSRLVSILKSSGNEKEPR
jgi:hypothetical protein